MTTAVARTETTDQEGSPQGESTATKPGELFSIPTDQVHESPFNPRKHFDHAALEDLAASLRASGQLVPVIVRPRSNGDGYELAAGHRRLRAAKLAGLPEILAVVRHYDDKMFLEVLTIENLQRDDLHPLEEAQGFADLMKHAGYDVAKIAARTGRSEKYVYDRLKLLQLTPAAKKLFLEGLFEAGHAILLARLNPEQQEQVLGDIKTLNSTGATGLLFEDTEISHGQGKLELADRIKPISVRELQQRIDHQVRFKPEEVDPFLFPETSRTLQEAAVHQEKVVHITREYRIDDGAKDEKIRTYGLTKWRRADGNPDPSDKSRQMYSFGKVKGLESPKICEHSVIGIVVAGPGRSEAFRVCVNRDKCHVHWPTEAAAAEKRKKAVKKDAKAGGGTKHQEKAEDLWKRQEAQRLEKEKVEEAERARWKKAAPQLMDEIRIAIEKLTDKARGEIVLRFAQPDQYDRWAKELAKLAPKRDLLTHAVFLITTRDMGEWNFEHEVNTALEELGVGNPDKITTAIVDQVAPKPEPKKATADVSKTEKKPKKPAKAKKGKK
jgi:ParB/RepB/Spo0J family partition protein